MLKERRVDYEPHSGRVRSSPRQVFLDLTSRCNLECVICSVDYGRTPPEYAIGEMSLATIERLRPWTEAAESVNLNIVGEPLIHSRFLDALARVGGREPNVHFNTNGLGLRPRVCERLAEGPVRSVAVSIDGWETNERVRGVSYETVRSRILNLIDARRRRESRLPEVGIAFTLMRSNCEELPRILDDLLPRGLDMVHVQPLIVFYESLADENPYGVEGIDELLASCTDRARRHGVRFTAFRSRFRTDERYSELDPEDLQVGGVSEQFGCIDPFYEIKVRFDGEVLSCSYGLSLGLNVHDLELEEIWNHERYRALRRRLVERRFEGRCDGCPYVFGSKEAQLSAVRPGVRHTQEARFFGTGIERAAPR